MTKIKLVLKMENVKLIARYRKLSPKETFEFNSMVTITYHSCRLEDSTLTERETFWSLLETLPEGENESENNFDVKL